MRYLLDTNILIALSKCHAALGRRMAQHAPEVFGIPVIVLQELYYGAYRSDPARQAGNLANVRHMRFTLVDFNPQDANAAGRIRAELARAGTPIGPYDALIAAQALTRDLTLVTHNTREFARVPGLRVEDWL
ncbi:MAG: type II toxin-antitoxin system VapC family toxin [Pseudomonadota bacterium]|nr:type II toxin-antitoxin system VapC family toxin [Pseudomonadota bacterium]